jgi:hypothetical protein
MVGVVVEADEGKDGSTSGLVERVSKRVASVPFELSEPVVFGPLFAETQS